MSVFKVETEGHVATLWLANPDKYNAMGKAFWEDLPVEMAKLDADSEVRVVIIASEGKHFSVGLDLKGGMGDGFGSMLTGGLAAERLELYRTIKKMQGTFDVLYKSPKPVIAAVHGYCIGGALDLISACDIRYAVKDAIVSLRETRIAMVADVGSLQRLPGIIGKGHLRELAFTGRDFDAQKGEQMGLFNATFASQEEMMAAVKEKAQAIADNSPLAVQGSKMVLNRAEEESIDRALDHVALWNSSQLASKDLMEAMMAFAQKKKPEFKGE